MIRDPSDGSVKEKPVAGIPTTKPTRAENAQVQSGLPITNHKAEYLVRLEKSREWIRDYFNRPTEQVASGLRSPIDGEG